MSLKALKTYKTDLMIPNQISMIYYFYFLLHFVCVFYYSYVLESATITEVT